MSRLARTVASISVCVLAGCGATSTDFDWDRAFDFGRLRSWSWAPAAGAAFPDRLVAQRIADAIAAGFVARGFARQDAGGDFLIAWQARRSERLRATSSGEVGGDRDPLFEHWAGGGEAGVADIESYDEGTLIVDVVDPASGRVVWRGTAHRMLDRSPSPERSRQVIGDAVAALLERFPPR